MLKVESPIGAEYLDVVTRLLQQRRLANPDGEVWEAADLQWWWARLGQDERTEARVWRQDGRPVGAVVVTHWVSGFVGCDVLAAADFEPAWSFAAEQCARQDVSTVEMALPDSDVAGAAAARRAGFAPGPDVHAVTWLDPADRQAPGGPLPDGYRIVARADDRTTPHWLIDRNGPAIEERLGRCSLYDPRLDLAVRGPDGTIAGYAVFWADRTTGVGLVEPVRVHEAHGGRGLARHLVDAGLRGLAAHGCSRLKVSFQPSNAAAARAYTAAGFRIAGLDRTWIVTRPEG